MEIYFSREWTEIAPPENILRVLVCVRIMMRDAAFQRDFFALGGVKVLSTVSQGHITWTNDLHLDLVRYQVLL